MKRKVQAQQLFAMAFEIVTMVTWLIGDSHVTKNATVPQISGQSELCTSYTIICEAMQKWSCKYVNHQGSLAYSYKCHMSQTALTAKNQASNVHLCRQRNSPLADTWFCGSGHTGHTNYTRESWHTGQYIILACASGVKKPPLYYLEYMCICWQIYYFSIRQCNEKPPLLHLEYMRLPIHYFSMRHYGDKTTTATFRILDPLYSNT